MSSQQSHPQQLTESEKETLKVLYAMYLEKESKVHLEYEVWMKKYGLRVLRKGKYHNEMNAFLLKAEAQSSPVQTDNEEDDENQNGTRTHQNKKRKVDFAPDSSDTFDAPPPTNIPIPNPTQQADQRTIYHFTSPQTADELHSIMTAVAQQYVDHIVKKTTRRVTETMAQLTQQMGQQMAEQLMRSCVDNENK